MNRSPQLLIYSSVIFCSQLIILFLNLMQSLEFPSHLFSTEFYQKAIRECVFLSELSNYNISRIAHLFWQILKKPYIKSILTFPYTLTGRVCIFMVQSLDCPLMMTLVYISYVLAWSWHFSHNTLKKCHYFQGFAMTLLSFKYVSTK